MWESPSVNAAYQASRAEIGVSITSVYNKLNGIEATYLGRIGTICGQRGFSSN